METTRYSVKTVQKFMDYLSEIGLSVYGQSMNAETGEELGAFMDYNAAEIVARRKHIEQDTLWSDNG